MTGAIRILIAILVIGLGIYLYTGTRNASPLEAPTSKTPAEVQAPVTTEEPEEIMDEPVTDPMPDEDTPAEPDPDNSIILPGEQSAEEPQPDEPQP